jgi:hypothetical protein
MFIIPHLAPSAKKADFVARIGSKPHRGGTMRESHAILAIGCSLLLAAPATAKTRDLHDFSGNGGDGASPYANVTVDHFGDIFGTTSSGGDLKCSFGSGLGCGTVFETSPPAGGSTQWKTRILYRFAGGTDGGSPSSTLTLDKDGALYGTTPVGPGGNVFRLSPPTSHGAPWTFETLYSFTGGADGNMDGGTNLIVLHSAVFGVTTTGGNSTACSGGCGTLFRLAPPTKAHSGWRYQRLVSFPGAASGPVWLAGPDANGHGYAATTGGAGTVTELTPPAHGGGRWSVAVIYRFTGHKSGSAPINILLGEGGVIYGIRDNASGEVFGLTPPATAGEPWTEATVFAFTGNYSAPTSLAPGPNGSLAGVSYGDVDFSNGYVWTLTPPAVAGDAWTYAQLGDKKLPSSNPVGVVYGRGGNLFGVMSGGDSDDGAVFEASPP